MAPHALAATFARKHLEAFRRAQLVHLHRRGKALNELSARIEAATAQGQSLNLSDAEMALLMNPTAGDEYPRTT